MDISDATLVTRNSRVVEAATPDLHVLLNEELRYLGLDPVATRVWGLLAEPRTVGDLVAALTSEFDVDAAQCHRDVVPFVATMADHGLVTLA